MIACRCQGCGQAFEAAPAGGHRLMCGDSTNQADVDALAAGERADLVFTSPPYAQQRDYTAAIGDWDALLRGVFGCLPGVVEPAAQLLVNLGLVHRDNEWQPYWEGGIAWMRDQGWRRFGWYVWDQGPGMPGDWNGRLAPSFEFLFHFNRMARKARKTVETKWGGQETHLRKDGSSTAMRDKAGNVGAWQHAGRLTQMAKIPDNVIRITRHKARGVETGHPAVFPVKLPVFMIETYSDPGDLVFDPFSGAGTTLLAGEATGRRVLAMEIAPIYVDLALARYRVVHPSASIVLAADGRTPDEVQRARAQEAA